MNKIIRIALSLLLTVAFLPAKNLNIAVDYNGNYSTNIFMNATAISDYVSQFHSGLNYSLKEFNFYLDATAGFYTGNSRFNSTHLEPGIEYLHTLKHRNSLFIGFSYPILKYKAMYTDFNYDGPLFHTYIKIYTSSQTILKGGYLFESRNYSDFKSFDFRNHTAFVELQRFFKSQTRLYLNVGLNYRLYPHVVGNFNFEEDYNYYAHSERGGYNGMGRNGGPGGGGGGNGWRPRYITINIPNLNGSLKITQAIGPHIGLSAEVQMKHNFRDLENADTLIKNAYVVYPHNDDYLWEGSKLSFGLKTVLFQSLAVESQLAYYWKDYPGIFILDERGNPLPSGQQRDDSLLHLSLELSKNLEKFEASAILSYKNNHSNDNYFHYKITTLSLGLSYHF
ncbi:MAG: hypothetical protein GY757_53360 [bacterium]|nr:hypothetical protein [bacterium]